MVMQIHKLSRYYRFFFQGLIYAIPLLVLMFWLSFDVPKSLQSDSIFTFWYWL